MSKFNTGDRVKRVRNSYHGGVNQGDVITIGRAEPSSFYRAEGEGDSHYADFGHGYKNYELVSRGVYGEPHIHADIIKEWADGAIIQYMTKLSINLEPVWADCGRNDPCWGTDIQYRVKEEDIKTPDQIEKESILEEMDKLKVRLEELKVK
jgi:hypothetical protein